MADKTCIVCGLGSNRADWQSKPNPACDSHSAAEVQAAIAKLQPQAVGGTKIPPAGTTAKA